MRKIRFRAKSIKDSNRWEWVYGWFTSDFTTQPLSTHLILTDKGVIYNVDPLTLGQYTGLKDKKRTKEYPDGQEIYEGDIVKDNEGYTTDVGLSEGVFFIQNIPSRPLREFVVEVVGNIYDNTNLLKEENNG